MREKVVLLAVAAAVGHPFAPFVISKDGAGDDEESEDAEENLHKDRD
jgi:hypothetical protein